MRVVPSIAMPVNYFAPAFIEGLAHGLLNFLLLSRISNRYIHMAEWSVSGKVSSILALSINAWITESSQVLTQYRHNADCRSNIQINPIEMQDDVERWKTQAKINDVLFTRSRSLDWVAFLKVDDATIVESNITSYQNVDYFEILNTVNQNVSLEEVKNKLGQALLNKERRLFPDSSPKLYHSIMNKLKKSKISVDLILIVVGMLVEGAIMEESIMEALPLLGDFSKSALLFMSMLGAACAALQLYRVEGRALQDEYQERFFELDREFLKNNNLSLCSKTSRITTVNTINVLGAVSWLMIGWQDLYAILMSLLKTIDHNRTRPFALGVSFMLSIIFFMENVALCGTDMKEMVYSGNLLERFKHSSLQRKTLFTASTVATSLLATVHGIGFSVILEEFSKEVLYISLDREAEWVLSCLIGLAAALQSAAFVTNQLGTLILEPAIKMQYHASTPAEKHEVIRGQTILIVRNDNQHSLGFFSKVGTYEQQPIEEAPDDDITQSLNACAEGFVIDRKLQVYMHKLHRDCAKTFTQVRDDSDDHPKSERYSFVGCSLQGLSHMTLFSLFIAFPKMVFEMLCFNYPRYMTFISSLSPVFGSTGAAFYIVCQASAARRRREALYDSNTPMSAAHANNQIESIIDVCRNFPIYWKGFLSIAVLSSAVGVASQLLAEASLSIETKDLKNLTASTISALSCGVCCILLSMNYEQVRRVGVVAHQSFRSFADGVTSRVERLPSVSFFRNNEVNSTGGVDIDEAQKPLLEP